MLNVKGLIHLHLYFLSLPSLIEKHSPEENPYLTHVGAQVSSHSEASKCTSSIYTEPLRVISKFAQVNANSVNKKL